MGGRIGTGTTARRRAGLIAAGAAAVLAAGTAGGVAWARDGIEKSKGYDVSTTYHVTVAPGETRDVAWPRLGDVRLGSECTAGEDTTAGTWGVGMKALTVTNTGTDPVVVSWEGEQTRWLAPGESDAFFAVGEVHNETTPDPRAGTFDMSVLATGGTSASGTIAWTGRFDTTAHTGTCTFSLNLHG
ncbi:hypothetical protein GCM10010531_28200 [Blastococcus jejuensis]|uniref:DUF4352 domain-containing protein n=1 Tax=Blastococcus jejuensis TaxID=351224 RepID=A0ABP6PA73_9ACTN